MGLLWFCLGAVLGLVAAWFLLEKRYEAKLSGQRADWTARVSDAERALEREKAAHSVTRQDLVAARSTREGAPQALAEMTANYEAALKLADDAKHQIVTLRRQNNDLTLRLAAPNGVAEADEDEGAEDERIEDLEAEVMVRDRRIAVLERELAEAKAQSTRIVAALPTTETPAAKAVGNPRGSDDLTKIKGIGPVLKDKLHGLGITTFRQIADFRESDIERVDAALAFRGRIEREKWVEQARSLVGP